MFNRPRLTAGCSASGRRRSPDRPWGPPSLLYNGYRIFRGGKERLGCDADPSPPSNAVIMKGYSCTSTPPMGCTACTEPQCLYMGALYLYLVLFALCMSKLCSSVWCCWCLPFQLKRLDKCAIPYNPTLRMFNPLSYTLQRM